MFVPVFIYYYANYLTMNWFIHVLYIQKNDYIKVQVNGIFNRKEHFSYRIFCWYSFCYQFYVDCTVDFGLRADCVLWNKINIVSYRKYLYTFFFINILIFFPSFSLHVNTDQEDCTRVLRSTANSWILCQSSMGFHHEP